MSRHARAAVQTRSARPAGLTCLLIGITLCLGAAATCILIPYADPGSRDIRGALFGCAGALLVSAMLLTWAHRRMYAELVSLHAETQQTLSDKHSMAEALRRERDFTSTVLDTAGALVMVCDRTGGIVKFNDACERLTGYMEQDLLGRPMWAVLLTPADGRIMRASMEALDGGRLRVRADASRRIEVTWRDRGGGQHQVAFTVTVLLNHVGEVDYFVATGVDVTEQRRNHEHLLQLATTDPLTGLVNRATFHGTLSVALDPAKGGHGAALLFCDLDGFKRINDTCGHAAGDELLIAVSQRLRRQVRQHDVVARLGGDEFVLLCPALDEMSAHRLADRIRKAICTPYGLTGGTVSVGVSVGVAVAQAGADPEAVLAEADAEMYRVKQRSKSNRWTLPPSMQAPRR
ncbi:MAG TPA: diguanylate cyclase [Mycobacteriales bacterium]|nr:diguanylate cyclase [Mycobacteriales bacterium]